MKDTLYPIKFQPILKEKIWGGTKLKSILNKESDLPNIGESWEISDVDDDTSVVINGELKGKSLKGLLELFKGDLIGEKNYQTFGKKFPLLIKFIDAKEDLSIQLHPNDEIAAKRHNSFGKTEMWYVMQADEDSNLIVGFNQKVTPEFDKDDYLNGNLQPVFFGSALNNFGVRELLDCFVEIAPKPRPKESNERLVKPEEEKFTGFVFKIHANMDPKHRDRY